jgi:uncharacterized protein YbaP (TraB family)
MKRLMIAVFLGLGACALAADPPPPVTAPPVSDWAPDESIVVSAKAEGPAFWHIRRGDSEIYILATVDDLPAGTTFEDSYMVRVIKGSRVILLPPTASSGFVSTAWFLLWNRSLLSMPDGKNLFDILPPGLKARFVAVLDQLKAPKDKLADDPPILAAMSLESSFATQAKLIKGGFNDTIEKYASSADVPVQRIADYDALGLVKELLRLPAPAQQVCLEEAVTNVEQRMVHVGPLAKAWAVGDVNGIKAHYTPHAFWQCANATASFAKLYDRAVADYLKAIHEALAKPGKTVLVTDVGHLLRNTGVVEKLHAEGLTIEGPAE